MDFSIPDISLPDFLTRQDLPVVFYFKVAMIGAPIPVFDAAFSEASGLNSEMKVEEVTEAGENRYVHKLPGIVSHPNLVLKRGLSTMISGLVLWCKASLEADLILPIQTNIIMVSLCNSKGLPCASWVCDRAYPVKWSLSNFDAQKNEVAIETMEFAYHSLIRML